MSKTFLFVGVAFCVASGCYAEATYHPYRPVATVGYVSPTAVVGAPSMSYVSPGVQVVANQDYPVFFSDGAYWRYDNGMWFRSSYWNRGWVSYNNVPVSVRGISQPWTYRNYRGGGVHPAYRTAQPAYRTAQPAYRATPQPAVRQVAPAPRQPVRQAAPPSRRR
jgi:hypothetical protein